jgi:hypothetical protein
MTTASSTSSCCPRDVSVEYIELLHEGPTREEEVIMVEHEPKLQAEVPPPKADQGEHQSIYTY